jgi:hypothetical protein
MNQQVPTVWRWDNLLDEKLGKAITGDPVGQGKIQRPLHLPAELLSLPLRLAISGRVAGIVLAQSFKKLWINQLWPFPATAMVFQNFPLFARTSPPGARMHGGRLKGSVGDDGRRPDGLPGWN